MRHRSFLLGLVIGAVVLGLSASPASAQSEWRNFGTPAQGWTLVDNWSTSQFPGEVNTALPGIEGLVTDVAVFAAGDVPPGPVGINFSSIGGTGSGAGNAAAANGRLTLAAFGVTGGSGANIGNNQTGGTGAASFSGIIQLNGSAASTGGFTDGAILRNSSNGATLTISRNVAGAADVANNDTAVRISTNATSIIQLGGNAATTIDIQTQLVMSTATDRRIILQGGAGAVRLRANNTLAYTAPLANAGQQNYVGIQGGWTINDGGVLRVGLDAAGAAMDGNLNLGINPAAVTANYLQMGNGTLRADSTFTLDTNRGITLTSLTAGQAGTLHVEGAATDMTYNGIITGAGNFGKAGAGDLFLGGVNTYTGSTTVSGGLLQTTGAGRLPDGTFVNMTGGAGTILDVTNITPIFGGLAGGNGGAGSEVRVSGANLTINTAVASPTAFRGLIAGAGGAAFTGGLVKDGVGTTILASAQTYTGGTTINAGTLQLGDGTNTGTIVGGVTNNGNLAFSPGATNDFSAIISGTGTVTKLGPNVQILSGANTYAGRTTVTNTGTNAGGTLAITSDGNLGTAPGAATAGHLVINGTATAAAILRADASFTLNANRGIALGPTTGAGIGTIEVAPTFTLTYGGVMDDQGGTGSFVKAGTGELVLSSDLPQAYAGSTTVNNGTLSVTGAGTIQMLPGTALTVGVGTNTAVLNLNNHNQSVTDLIGNATATINLGSGTLTVNPTATQLFAGVITGTGGLVKDGTNTQTLSGANTFTGPITINAGTLNVGGSANGTIAGTQAITNNGLLLDFDQAVNQTVSGNISGTGVLGKRGAGTLTLSGTNSYTGATVVTGGVVVAGSATALGNNSALSINGDNSTVRLNGNSITVGSLATSAAVATRIVENASGTNVTLTTGGLDSSTTFGGLIQNGAGGGTLALTKVGTGTFTLLQAHTYTGGTTVSGGVLQLGNGTANGSVVGNITDNASVVFNNGAAQTYSGVISGTGSLTKTGAGVLTLDGASTYGGATSITGGTLTLAGGADRLPVGTTVTLANVANTNLNLNGQNQALVALAGGGGTGGNVQLGTGTLTLNQTAANTYAGAISGGGSVVKNGNFELILDGANSFTGGLTINAGTVRVGTGGATGALANNVPITNGGALVVNKSNNLTLNGAITGTGSLTKEGAGALILGGANTYGGVTTVTAGTLQAGAANVLPSGGAVTLNGGTLSTGATTGFSQTAGTLDLDATSTIALGTGAHTLTFNNLASSGQLAGTLTVTGWAGSKFSSGTSGQIIFTGLGGNPNQNYSSWLANNVNFVGVFDTGPGGFFVDMGGGQFQLVPVPEPGTVLGIAAAGLAGLGVLRRRLRRKTESAVAA